MNQTSSIWQCILGNLLLRMGNSATGVLMGLVLAHVGREAGNVPAIAVGMLAASFYIAELVGAPVFGTLSDRFGRRGFLIAGPIFGAIAVQFIGWPSLLMVFPALLAPMALGRMIEGLSTATTAPSTLSLLSERTDDSASFRGRVMSWYEMATVVGIGFGFVAAGLLWDRFGHGAFLVVTLIYAAALGAFVLVREGPRISTARTTAHAAYREVLATSRLLCFVPAWLSVNTIVGLWFTHAAFQLTGAHRPGQFLTGGFTGSSLGGAFAMFSVAFIVGVFLWGLAIGRRRKTTLMLLSTAGIFVISLALLAINHYGSSGGSTVPGLTALFLIGVVIASGFTPAALAYLADISEEMIEHRGTIMGLYSVMLGLGQLMGGLVGGIFAQLGDAVGGPFRPVAGVDGLITATVILGSFAVMTLVLLHRAEEPQATLSAVKELA